MNLTHGRLPAWCLSRLQARQSDFAGQHLAPTTICVCAACAGCDGRRGQHARCAHLNFVRSEDQAVVQCIVAGVLRAPVSRRQEDCLVFSIVSNISRQSSSETALVVFPGLMAFCHGLPGCSLCCVRRTHLVYVPHHTFVQSPAVPRNAPQNRGPLHRTHSA